MITSINENTWRIEEEGVRFFLLEGSAFALLIDSGMKTRNAKEIAESLTTKTVKLLNTHADPDHIGSNFEFSDFYMHPAEAGNYYKQHNGTGNILPVWDKDILDPGGRPLEIISLPGHTPGSIAVLDCNNKILFSGDVIQDSNIFMFGERREMHAYILSLIKLEGMTKKFDCILPSHGSPLLKPEFIKELRVGAEKVLNGEITGRPVDKFGIKAVLYDIGTAGILYDR